MEVTKAEGGAGVPEERRENGGRFDWSGFFKGFPTQHLGTGVAVVAGSGTAAEGHASVRMCIEKVNGAGSGCPNPVGVVMNRSLHGSVNE
ncbi:unnamed protein product [Miscanthus lutarioriparius]|uniref:Uncharacterized protein n=1 Tax=Miscanthus lutarioriparius TaxID=422564 RepID=A0A811QNW6_9POAL|nr:unnamed protein product [Miscanthus lutarioriparius]